ncbi:MAG: hypothetical protein WAJ88_18805 [Pseudolabrys sp.]
MHRAIDMRLAWKADQLHVVDKDLELLARRFTESFFESVYGADGSGQRRRKALQKIDTAPLIRRIRLAAHAKQCDDRSNMCSY